MARIGTGSHLVQRLEHFLDVLQVAVRQDEGQVARRRIRHRRPHEAPQNALRRRTAAVEKISQPLDNDAAAEDIGQIGDVFAVFDRLVEGLGELLRHEDGKVRVFAALVSIAVAVDRQEAVVVFFYDEAIGIHAEGTNPIVEGLAEIDELRFVHYVGNGL